MRVEWCVFWRKVYLYKLLREDFMLFPLLLLAYLALPLWALWRFRNERQRGLHSGYGFCRKHLWWGNEGPSSIASARLGVQAMLLAVLGTIPLMGLPGAAFIELAMTAGLLPREAFDGDVVWPAALALSMLMPLGWLLGSLLLRHWGKQLQSLVRKTLLILFVVLWITGAAVFLVHSL